MEFEKTNLEGLEIPDWEAIFAELEAAGHYVFDMRRPPKACEQCGSDYKPKRADGKYCSAKCRSAAWRRKHSK